MTEYYNPQNEKGPEKRLFLLFLIFFAGIALIQFIIPKPAPQPEKPAPEPQVQQPQAQQPPQQKQPPPSTPTPGPSTTKKTQVKSKEAKPTQPAMPATPQLPVAETVIENDYAKITFTNQGGQVKHWILKKYVNDKGEPLDMINPNTAVLGYPLSLWVYDAGLRQKLKDVVYKTDATPTSAAFEWTDGQIKVKKSFKFDTASYVLVVDTEVTDNGSPVQAFPQWPGGFGDQTRLSMYGGGRIDWQQGDEIVRKDAVSGGLFSSKKWVVGGETIKGPFNWVATADQYFGAVFMPQDPRDAVLVTLHEQVQVDGSSNKISVLGIAVGNSNGPSHERFFLGPKATEVLETIQTQSNGPDLRGVVDWGKLGFISRPLFALLKLTHQHLIPNWGWAIAFLTVMITLVLLPLRITSIKSALKMQKIQPQLKAIQEKYKRYGITDPRRAQMQKEMSELYKREGVNPLGGCFPLLLQMPFLIAFYSMLANAVDLRQAHWSWIPDLSSPDPVHILPIAIIITMFVTQRSTPQAGMDPAQQKMLSIMMPVMLGIISWNLPSGLGIYWAISNLLQWIQQAVMNRTEFGKQMRKAAVRKR